MERERHHMTEVKSDIEIARAATKKPILEIGAKLGIPPEHLLPYGHDKAKISADKRLWAEVMAWKSPVKCRLISSIGTTCA